MAITLGDYTKVFAPVIDLDQTEHIYDNRYNGGRDESCVAENRQRNYRDE
jgi:hypothetical protein